MEFLRDPLWQSVGAVTAVLALLLYAYVERKKISRLYTEAFTQLQITRGRLSNVLPTIVHGVNIFLSVLFFSLLAIFILIAPIFLYKELIQHQSLFIDPFIINSKSMIYGLVLIVWCLSIMTFNHKLIIDRLRNQIDYLNRVPGIQKLKGQYNKQIFDSVAKQWDDFRTELVNKYDDSPFVIDLANCSLLDVEDETLIIGCPNKVVHKRMNPSIPRDDIPHEEYDKRIRDRKSIEKLIRRRFPVRRIEYTLKQTKT